MIQYLEDMLELATAGNPQGVFFFISLYSFVLLAYSFVYQLRVSGWPSAIGDLDDAEIDIWGVRERQSSEQMFQSKASYRYIVGGEEFIGTRVSPWLFLTSRNAMFLLKNQLSSVKITPSGKVEVYYNPNNPKKSYLIKPGIIGLSITIFCATFPAVVYVMKYHN